MPHRTIRIAVCLAITISAFFLGDRGREVDAVAARAKAIARQEKSGDMSNMKGMKSDAKAKKATSPKLTRARKIALAMSAGPPEIAKHAAIFDMTTMTSTPKQLRAGTNGWACYAAIGEPMCLDKEWQKWAEAWMSKTDPKIEQMGVAYMLRGDMGASNTDPFATKRTADNAWVVSPAHIMLLFPDPKALDAYPTDPAGGGPWVMWKGTPYAHVMVPVSAAKTATMPKK